MSWRQVWDLNKPAPAEVGRDYHVVLASNVLHTAANMASALPAPTACLCDLNSKLMTLKEAIDAPALAPQN